MWGLFTLFIAHPLPCSEYLSLCYDALLKIVELFLSLESTVLFEDFPTPAQVAYPLRSTLALEGYPTPSRAPYPLTGALSLEVYPIS